MTQMDLPFPVKDCWDLIDRVPLKLWPIAKDKKGKLKHVSIGLQRQVLKEIASFLINKKACHAADEHFARKCDKSVAQVKNALRALREQGVVHFFEQSRAGIRGRGSRPKLKAIEWSAIKALVQSKQAIDPDQRLTTDRPAANQHTDQRLTSERPAANQHTDQRLTVRYNSLVNTKEDQQTREQPVVVDVLDLDSSEPRSQVDSRFRFFQLSLQDQWAEVTERLRSYRDSDGASIVAFPKAIKAAKEEHGWAPSECMRLLNQAESENRPSSHVANWFIKGTPPQRTQDGSTLRLKPFPLVGSSLCDNKLNRLWKLASEENWIESRFQSVAESIVREWRELCELENSQDDLRRLNYLRSLFPDARTLFVEAIAHREVSTC